MRGSGTGSGPAKEASAYSGDFVSNTAFLAGFDRKCTSQQFKGGDLTAIMGGGKVDFREADFQEGAPVIDVSVIMGGLEIIVPETWTVDSQVTPVLGGYEDKTRAPKDAGKRLVIRGSAVLGGVEVKN
jgi:hypothetical protein